MIRLAAIAFLSALPGIAIAQGAPKTPPIIDDATIGLLRQHQAGSLILPEGTPPFPAVVVLHGCNGIAPTTRQWARRLASWGYAALIVDSFTPRGLSNVCGQGTALLGRDRAVDALAGAKYLRSRSDIDSARIGALGYSHGGWTAIAAARESIVARSGTPPFAAIVALYPNCPPGAPPLVSDLQILAGGADDWAPPQRCTDLIARYQNAAAHRPLLKIYPGAFHSFDVRRPDRIYFGHRLAYDEKAATDAFETTKKFLDDRLKQ